MKERTNASTPVDAFLAQHGGVANTIEGYRCDLEQLAQWRNTADWSTLTAAEMIGWRIGLSRTWAPATVARKCAAARSFVRWLGRTDLLDALPWRRDRGARIAPLTGAGIERLVSATDGLHVNEALVWRDRAMIALLVGCGLTVSELIALDVDDVVGGVVRIGGEDGRTVPLTIEAQDALDDYRFDARSELDPRTPRRRRRARIERPETTGLLLNNRGERLTRQGCSFVLSVVAKAAGLTGVSPRRLRAAYAARLFAEGLDVRDVAMLLGVAIEAAEAYRPRRPRRAA